MKNKLNQLSALHFFNDGYLASIILLLPFIQKDLNLSLTNIGFLTSLISLSGIFLSLPAGYLGHKFGGMKIVSLCLLFYGMGFISVGLSSSFILLVTAFLIASLGFGIFHPIAFSLVAKWTDHKKIGRLVEEFIKNNLPKGVKYKLKAFTGSNAFYTDFKNPYAQKTAGIFKDVFKNETLFNRSGGSVGAAEILQRIFKKPVILIGFSLPDDNIHAPNENYDEEMFFKGIVAMEKILAQ